MGRIGVGRIGHLAAQLPGTSSQRDLVDLVRGLSEVVRRRVALLLPLFQLTGPLGLFSGPSRSCPAIFLCALAQLTFLVTEVIQLGTLSVGLAGVPGLDLHVDVAETLLDGPQALGGLPVTGRRIAEGGAGLPLCPRHGVAPRLSFTHLVGHTGHNGPGVGTLPLGQLGDRGQLRFQLA